MKPMLNDDGQRPAHGQRPRCDAVFLGRVAYEDGLTLQEEAVRRRAEDESLDSLFLLEHPHVYTLGRGANEANVLATIAELTSAGASLFKTGRGGDVTYHGPGQLVAYPVISLKPDRCDVHRYVRDLEEVMIRVAMDFGVTASRIDGLTGIWVGDRKLGALGVRIARWITSHGIALNVSTDLSNFDRIVPCGIVDKGVTSLEALTGRRIPLSVVAESVATNFGGVFERSITYRSAAREDRAARP